MAPNEFVIRPLKNASGDWKMNCDTNLIRFDESKPGKNNMKFANITYKGWSKRVCVETPDMDIPAGVVQYPKPEDAVPTRRSAILS
jgi:hypothetical protein